MVRMGIVGTGFHIGIAKLHIAAYQRMPNVTITALFDIDRERAERYKVDFGLEQAVVCDSYQELLALTDAVTICTPNAFHIDMALQALEQKKHVLCEKPLGRSAKECQKLVEAAAESDLVCAVGLCYRYIPGYRFMKKLIDENVLGNIYFLRAEMGGNRIADPEVKLEWRMQETLSGAGAIADFGSHLLDLADYLLASGCGKITELQALANTFISERKDIADSSLQKVTNEDVGVIIGKMEKGTLLSFSTSRIGSKHRMQIVGEGGTLEFDGSRPEEVSVFLKKKEGGYQGMPEVLPVPEELYLVDEYGPKQGFEVNFYLQNKAFVQAILEKSPLEVTMARGQYIQQLIDAAVESARTGQSVVMEGD